MMSCFALAATLSVWLAAEPELARQGCERPSSLCLDADGLPVAGDALPATVGAGSTIDVKVLGCRSEHADHVFQLAEESVESDDRIFRDLEVPTASGEKNRERAVECPLEVLAASRFTVPTGARARTYAILFTREGPAVAGARRVERRESYAATIRHGRYYLDIGVLVPVVIDGERKIVAADTGSPDTRRLSVHQDLSIFPALMLNVFPGGRDLAAIGSFSAGDCEESVVKPGPRACRAARHRRRAANALGLQIGVELDLRRRDHYFFGGLFEPVAGLSISAGLALTRLEFIRRGRAEGDEIPTPTITDAEGEPDPRQYVERLWRPRFYVGVTFSFDIIRTLAERRRSDVVRSILPE